MGEELLRDKGPVAFTRAVGGDVLYRCNVQRTEHPRVQVVEHVEGDSHSIEYRTPFGTLCEVRRAGRILGRQVEELADYDAFRYVYENQQFTVDEGRYADAFRTLGDAVTIHGLLDPSA